MSDETAGELLGRLASGKADAAWSEFLAHYSSLVMHVVRRYEHASEPAADCFIYVCGALSDDGFRRLRSFRPDGPARFRTWLMAVVANLCVDWHRRQHGRARPLRRVSGLPELDQHVYRCIYLEGMSRAQCAAALLPRFPQLTEAAVAGINARLFALLTPQQRWQLSTRTAVRRPVPAGDVADDDEPAWQVPAAEPGPDDLAALSQEQRQLRDGLAKLPPGQRLLLRLRYEQELTLAEIARLTGQPDPFRVNRQIQTAVGALANLLSGQQFPPERKT